MDSGFQENFRLPAVQIIPRRDRFLYRPTNLLNEPAIQPKLPEVTSLFQFIEALKAKAASDKIVIILLNVVVVRNL